MDFIPMHAWHPMLVHFPLGLLLGGSGAELVGWLARRPGLRRAGLVLLVAGVLLAIPAITTGLLAYGRVDHSDASHAIMEFHRNLMLTSVGLFVVVVLWRWRAGESVAASPGRAGFYALLLGVANITLIVGADRGAALVYGHATGLGSGRLVEILRDRGDLHVHPAEASRSESDSSAADPSAAPTAPTGRRTAPSVRNDRDARNHEEDARPHTH